MTGFTDELKKLWAKLVKALSTLDAIKAKHKETRRNILRAYEKIARMPHGAEKNALLVKANKAKLELESLEKRERGLSKTAAHLVGSVKKLLGLSGGLGVALPVAAVAGLIISVGVLWKLTVTKTRELNLRARALEMVADGKLSPGQFEKFVESQGRAQAGPMADIMKVLTLGLIMIIAPTILQGLRRT